MINIIVLTLALIIITLLIVYNFPLAKVDGRSMYPTYKDGGILLTTRLFNIEKLKVGDVYVFTRINDDGEEILVVKRLTDLVSYPKLGLDNACYFEGDNPEESYDSRHYGFIDKEQIVAKVLWQIKK